MHDSSKKLKVICPIQSREGKTFWRLMGVAFPNQDGSTNVYLDGLPVNGKLQIREWEDGPWSKKDDAPARPAPAGSSESLPF